MFYQEWLQEQASTLIPALTTLTPVLTTLTPVLMTLTPVLMTLTSVLMTLTPVLTTLLKHRSIRALLMERSALRGALRFRNQEEGVGLASKAGTPST